MSERGPGDPTIASEAPTYIHHELHAPAADQRDDGVTQWYEQRQSLTGYSLAELESVRTELHELPEVIENEQERVTVKDIAGMSALAYEHVAEQNRPAFAKVELQLAGLVSELDQHIAQYAEIVIRFQRTKIAAQRKEPEEYQSMIQAVDTARNRSHDALMSHLNALTRFLARTLPQSAGTGFQVTNWEDDLQKHWFSVDELHDRHRIGEWALQQDIVRKSEAIEAAIDTVLENQNADAG